MLRHVAMDGIRKDPKVAVEEEEDEEGEESSACQLADCANLGCEKYLLATRLKSRDHRGNHQQPKWTYNTSRHDGQKLGEARIMCLDTRSRALDSKQKSKGRFEKSVP